MKIGIIGAGTVGSSLGKGWAAGGHKVMFSSRTPDSDRMKALLAEAGPTTQAGTVAEALAFGDVIAVAIRWNVLEEVVASVGDWSGKVVIDATNRFGPSDSDRSAAEDLAALVPGARVVKAFNTIGAEHYTNPVFGDDRATMFIAGDDADAKATVADLAEELGFEVVDAGGLQQAILLENLGALWVTLARVGYGRDIAFKLLRR